MPLRSQRTTNTLNWKHCHSILCTIDIERGRKQGNRRGSEYIPLLSNLLFFLLYNVEQFSICETWKIEYDGISMRAHYTYATDWKLKPPKKNSSLCVYCISSSMFDANISVVCRSLSDGVDAKRWLEGNINIHGTAEANNICRLEQLDSRQIWKHHTESAHCADALEHTSKRLNSMEMWWMEISHGRRKSKDIFAPPLCRSCCSFVHINKPKAKQNAFCIHSIPFHVDAIPTSRTLPFQQ